MDVLLVLLINFGVGIVFSIIGGFIFDWFFGFILFMIGMIILVFLIVLLCFFYGFLFFIWNLWVVGIVMGMVFFGLYVVVGLIYLIGGRIGFNVIYVV